MGSKTKLVYLLLVIILIAFITVETVQAKRIYSSSSNRRSSSSSSSSVRRNSHTKPSTTHSHSSHSHSSHSSPSHTNPSLSHTGLASLSYAGYNQQANKRPSSTGTLSASRPSTNTHHTQSAAPIGWNVPPKQGPPPAYSASNPVGGAKTNVHEKPPAYNPSYSAAPSYKASTNTASRPVTATNSNNRNRFNSTGGSFGSGGYHKPIQSTNTHNLQSSYPKQQTSVGVTYHRAGNLPPGASYHPPNQLPPGATYYPSPPVGTTFHSPGHLPVGASYYPSPVPAPSYYPSPSVLPVGATFLPVGSALPPGATFVQQPPKSSSGFGFGSGLIAGTLGGAVLGHVLTPTHNHKVIEHVPSYSGGSYGGGGSRDDNNDKIIIINNGPPGSVTTSDVGGGTTVINTGSTQPQNQSPVVGQAPAPSYAPPPQTAGQPPQLYPLNPTVGSTNNGAAVGGTATGFAAGATGTSAVVQHNMSPQPAPVANTAGAEQPAAGGIICVPVKVPEPDPHDSTKTIEADKVVCYPAPPPEASTPIALPTATSAGVSTASTTATSPAVVPTDASLKVTTLEGGVVLAPIQTTTPLVVPEGFVPLAPINQYGQPDVMKIPGYYNNMKSSALISQESGVHVSNSASNVNISVLSTLLLIFVSSWV